MPEIIEIKRSFLEMDSMLPKCIALAVNQPKIKNSMMCNTLSLNLTPIAGKPPLNDER